MYEVVLSKPASEKPKSFVRPPKNALSKEDIDNKLEAAFERKKCLQLMKNKFITKQRRAADKVKEKKEVFHNNFIQFARESLEQKMVSVKEQKEKVKLTKVTANSPFVTNDHCDESVEAFDILLEKIETIEKRRSECFHSLKNRLQSQESLMDKVQKDIEIKSLNMKHAFENTIKNLQEKCQSAVKEIENDKERPYSVVTEEIMKHGIDEMAKCDTQEEQKIQEIDIRGIQETEKRGIQEAEKRAIQEIDKGEIQEAEKQGFAKIAKPEIEEIDKKEIEEMEEQKNSEIAKLVAEEIAKHGIEDVTKHVTKEIEKSQTQEMEKHGTAEIGKEKNEELEQHVLNVITKRLTKKMEKLVTEEVQRCLTEKIVKHGIDEIGKCGVEDVTEHGTDGHK